jgi:hypothetical protein
MIKEAGSIDGYDPLLNAYLAYESLHDLRILRNGYQIFFPSQIFRFGRQRILGLH